MPNWWEDSEEQERPPKHATSMFIREGFYYFNKEKYKQALQSFNVVLEREPTNVSVLVARSRCYFKLMMFDLAMQDAEEAFRLDPHYPRACCQMGEMQFVMGDFEQAHESFFQGAIIRPKDRTFEFMMNKCKAAILNCVGSQSNLVITKKDVRNLKEEKLAHLYHQKKQKPQRKTKWDGHFSKEVPIKIGAILSASKVDFVARQVLGPIAKDKEFLTTLAQCEESMQPTTSTDLHVSHSVREALDFLDDRQMFWRRIKPIHSRHPPKDSSPGQQDLSEEELPLVDRAVRLLMFALQSLEDGYFQKAIDASFDVIAMVKDAPIDELPMKPFILAQAHELFGDALQFMGNPSSAKYQHKQQLDIGNENNFARVQKRAHRNLYKDYFLLEDYVMAVDCLKELMENFVDDDLEKAFILKEMADCQYLMKDIENAVNTANIALELATLLEDQDAIASVMETVVALQLLFAK